MLSAYVLNRLGQRGCSYVWIRSCSFRREYIVLAPLRRIRYTAALRIRALDSWRCGGTIQPCRGAAPNSGEFGPRVHRCTGSHALAPHGACCATHSQAMVTWGCRPEKKNARQCRLWYTGDAKRELSHRYILYLPEQEHAALLRASGNVVELGSNLQLEWLAIL
jgi:hypothetical protein